MRLGIVKSNPYFAGLIYYVFVFCFKKFFSKVPFGYLDDLRNEEGRER